LNFGLAFSCTGALPRRPFSDEQPGRDSQTQDQRGDNATRSGEGQLITADKLFEAIDIAWWTS
jgi:hypothetical protein